MARKPNYNFEKRLKEQAREAKRDAKLAEKARRKEEAARGELPPDEVSELPTTE